jgi:hypothetical protein
LRMPKCEATTDPTLWWRPDSIDFKPCKRNASVRIDGINLCLQHAGGIAVQKLLNSGDAVRLDTANPYGPLNCTIKDRYKKYIKKTR